MFTLAQALHKIASGCGQKRNSYLKRRKKTHGGLSIGTPKETLMFDIVHTLHIGRVPALRIQLQQPGREHTQTNPKFYLGMINEDDKTKRKHSIVHCPLVQQYFEVLFLKTLISTFEPQLIKEISQTFPRLVECLDFKQTQR